MRKRKEGSQERMEGKGRERGGEEQEDMMGN